MAIRSLICSRSTSSWIVCAGDLPRNESSRPSYTGRLSSSLACADTAASPARNIPAAAWAGNVTTDRRAQKGHHGNLLAPLHSQARAPHPRLADDAGEEALRGLHVDVEQDM